MVQPTQPIQALPEEPNGSIRKGQSDWVSGLRFISMFQMPDLFTYLI
jgi:hypothetical protein